MKFAVYSAWPQIWPNIYGQISRLSNLPTTTLEVAKGLQAQSLQPVSEPKSIKHTEKGEAGPQWQLPQLISELSPAAQSSRLLLQRLLRQADAGRADRTEPSWSVLAESLKETTFVEAWRTLQFESDMLGVNADQTLEAVKPLIIGHPFERFLDSYGSRRDVAAESMKNFTKSLNESLLDVFAISMLRKVYELAGRETWSVTQPRVARHSDLIFEDYIQMYVALKNDPVMSSIFRASPHWPRAIAVSIDVDWQKAEPHAAEWERAKPYAEEAAKSYSGWGLEIAARCEEGLEHWEDSEAYHRAISERYEGASPNWYFWCARLNRGNIDSARKLAKARFSAH
jgi:hypothetical protein